MVVAELWSRSSKACSSEARQNFLNLNEWKNVQNDVMSTAVRVNEKLQFSDAANPPRARPQDLVNFSGEQTMDVDFLAAIRIDPSSD